MDPLSRISSSGNDSSLDTPSTASYVSTETTNTRATTPDPGLPLNYRTILISHNDMLNIKLLEAAFDKYEPFDNWACAFCGKEREKCGSQTWHIGLNSVPETKLDFVKYLGFQGEAACTLQASLASYVLELEQHVPFGLTFNADQKTKCNTLNQQLEILKERVEDLKTACILLVNDGTKVPDGMKKACGNLEHVLANGVGNVRENHVCFKLNYMLTKKEVQQEMQGETPVAIKGKGG